MNHSVLVIFVLFCAGHRGHVNLAKLAPPPSHSTPEESKQTTGDVLLPP